MIDTYENAIKIGYVRGMYNLTYDTLSISNLPNYNFNINTLRRKTKESILDYVMDNNIEIVSDGKGNILDEFSISNMKEGWKDLVAAGVIGLGTLTGGNVNADDTHPPEKPPIMGVSSDIQSSFIDYIKNVENGGKIGYNVKLKRWYPHKSFEGGGDTIGYGHKIKSNEDYKLGLTDIQVTDLLKQDLKTAKDIVHKEIGNIKLTNTQEEMFIDFVFNLGSLKKFPKFKTAVLNNDLVTMNQEYQRYSNGKKLKGRNSAFFSRFLKV